MKFSFSFLFIVLFLTFTACKKEQPQLNNGSEDCSCEQEVSADFLMEEQSVNSESVAYYTDTDSIQLNKNVRFSPKQIGGTYKWYIGSEILENTNVMRFFGSSTAGLTVPITLVHKKTPNKICFPNDDGYDSVVKYLTITSFPIYTGTDYDFGSIEGSYRVKSAHLPDSFDVEIQVVSDLGLYKVNFFNYDGQGTNCLNSIRLEHGANYKELKLLGGTTSLQCDYLRGRIKNIGNGKIEMSLSFFSISDPNYVIRKYLGRKLN